MGEVDPRLVQAVIASTNGLLLEVQQECIAQRQRADRLEATLRELERTISARDEKWGSHSEGCAIYEPIDRGPCDCGWQEVEVLLQNAKALLAEPAAEEPSDV